VLADEPTGNLDSRSAADVLDVLAEVHSGGATIVMVTHAREVAERGTRIVHMLDGCIDAEELLVAAAAKPSVDGRGQPDDA
jgi:putative ABC transport system ATP-binding protein